MIVVGLNTRIELPGRHDGHDASACLFADGALLNAVEEERFCRVVHAPGRYPRESVSWCLQDAGLDLDDVDVIAVGWDPRLQVDYPGPSRSAGWLEEVLPSPVFPRRRTPEVVFVPNHLSHAAGAFAGSPFDAATVIVVDDASERVSMAEYRVDSDGWRLVRTRPVAHSVGLFYQALSQFVGLGEKGEAKTVGLAPYGEARYELADPLSVEIVPATEKPTLEHREDILAGWMSYFASTSKSERNEGGRLVDSETARTRWEPTTFPTVYRDLASSGQATLETSVVFMADEALRDAPTKNLVITGRVALNCVANGELVRRRPEASLYVQPAADDAGASIGAAVYVLTDAGIPVRLPRNHVYAGPSFAPDRVAAAVERWGLAWSRADDPATATAQHLAAGRIVAWFCGRAEFGPRALGARSLLANPKTVPLTRLNSVKRRQNWRPLAPTVLAESAALVFDQPLDPDVFAHMLVTAPVTGPAASDVGAVVHVDGSTRPQVLVEADAPTYARLLRAFQELSDVPAVANTSLNIAAPMVNSLGDAVQTFATSEIDCLVVEDIMLEKEPLAQHTTSYQRIASTRGNLLSAVTPQ
jgi:carbamoyltransferase